MKKALFVIGACMVLLFGFIACQNSNTTTDFEVNTFTITGTQGVYLGNALSSAALSYNLTWQGQAPAGRTVNFRPVIGEGTLTINVDYTLNTLTGVLTATGEKVSGTVVLEGFIMPADNIKGSNVSTNKVTITFIPAGQTPYYKVDVFTITANQTIGVAATGIRSSQPLSNTLTWQDPGAPIFYAVNYRVSTAETGGGTLNIDKDFTLNAATGVVTAIDYFINGTIILEGFIAWTDVNIIGGVSTNTVTITFEALAANEVEEITIAVADSGKAEFQAGNGNVQLDAAVTWVGSEKFPNYPSQLRWRIVNSEGVDDASVSAAGLVTAAGGSGVINVIAYFVDHPQITGKIESGLFPVTAIISVILTPATVIISDHNLTQVVTVGGTAVSAITVNYNRNDVTGLPLDFDVVPGEGIVTISVDRLATGSVQGVLVVGVTREGVTSNLTVNINLTSAPTLGRVWNAIPGGEGEGRSTITAQINDIAYNDGTFVAVAHNSRKAWSDDYGLTWTGIPSGDEPGQSLHAGHIRGITAGGGRFVAVGDMGRITWSDNGKTWNLVPGGPAGSTFDPGPFGTAHFIWGIAWGEVDIEGEKAGRFVAVGATGRMAWSDNGVTWNAIAAGDNGSTFASNQTIQNITFGDGRFVAVGAGGRMAWSDNGVTWNAIAAGDGSTFASNQTIFDVGFGNGRFVAGGANGRLAWSDNGTTWTAIMGGAQFGPHSPGWDPGVSTFGINQVNAITWGGSRFVAVGQSGRLAWSENGTLWNAVESGQGTTFNENTFNAGSIHSIAFGKDTFIAGSTGGRMAWSAEITDK